MFEINFKIIIILRITSYWCSQAIMIGTKAKSIIINFLARAPKFCDDRKWKHMLIKAILKIFIKNISGRPPKINTKNNKLSTDYDPHHHTL